MQAKTKHQTSSAEGQALDDALDLCEVVETPLLDRLWQCEALKHLRAVGWPEDGTGFFGLKTGAAVWSSLASHFLANTGPNLVTSVALLGEEARGQVAAEQGLISFKVIADHPGRVRRPLTGAGFDIADVAVSLHLISGLDHGARVALLNCTPAMHTAAGLTPEPCILSLQAVPWASLRKLFAWKAGSLSLPVV